MRFRRRGVRSWVQGIMTFLGLGALGLGWLTTSTEWGTQRLWKGIQLRLPAGLYSASALQITDRLFVTLFTPGV